MIRRLMIAACAAISVSGPASAEPVVDSAVYDRAAEFLPDNPTKYVLNASIQPHWRVGPHERLTYWKDLGDGKGAFVVVDAETGKASSAFDQTVVAAGLAKALGKPVEPSELPFRDYDEVSADEIRFDARDKTWTCSVRRPSCAGHPSPKRDPSAVPSPDGRWIAYVEDFNLWIRSTDGKIRFALTTDGELHNAYGRSTELEIGAVSADGRDHAMKGKDGRRIGLESGAVLLWSPDSRMVLTQKLDERRVREISIVQSTPPDKTYRPLTTTWRMAMPNDPDLPMAQLWVFDVEARTGQKVGVDPLPIEFMTPIEAGDAWWSADNRRIYLIARTRYAKSETLEAVDSATGAATPLISETGKTFVESASLGSKPMVYVLRDGDILWFSERDGWGSLYLYDAAGALKRRLTAPGWTVRNVLHVDEDRGLIYVAGNERAPRADPYFRYVYSVSLKNGAVKELDTEDADHSVLGEQESGPGTESTPEVRNPAESWGFSPYGRYFVETLWRPDAPSRTVLRTSAGRLVGDIEDADISQLKALGYQRPVRFNALAADGKTVLYGVMLRPSNFDPTRLYPVLDSPYPGPQINRVRLSFEANVLSYAQAYAELGFVVVMVDGRGTYGRSKAFHDESYGRLGQAGHLDDHVAVIKQLAERFPYMDISRVGIFGTSGGGYAAVHAMLTYPDFFKVGVADAGNHEQRAYLSSWGEWFNGPDNGENYKAASNSELAANLKGKLLLLHGDMDTNVSPSQTLQLASALIDANKDFELLIVPNAGHGTIRYRKRYALRRSWDFFVKNLQGARPPDGYNLAPKTLAPEGKP